MKNISVMIEEDDFATECIGVVDNDVFYGFVTSLSYLLAKEQVIMVNMNDLKLDKDWNSVTQEKFPIHSLFCDNPKTDSRITMIPELDVQPHIIQAIYEAKELYNSL
jgi:hypothetical protein